MVPMLIEIGECVIIVASFPRNFEYPQDLIHSTIPKQHSSEVSDLRRTVRAHIGILALHKLMNNNLTDDSIFNPKVQSLIKKYWLQ